MKKAPGASLSRHLVAGVFASSIGFAALAQDTTGGIWLDFGLAQTLEATDNLSFAPSSPGVTLRSTTDLSFGIRSETNIQSLEATGTIALRAIDRPRSTGVDTSFSDPRFTLSYDRRVPSSRLRAYVRFIEGDVAFIDPLTDFLDADGAIVITPDFIDLSGEGVRTSLTYGASLSFFDDRPFGLTISADVTDLSYTDTTTPALIDSTRIILGAVARFDITPTVQATLGVSREDFENALGTETETTSVNGDVTIVRPNGELGFGIGATETSAGTRYSLSASRSYIFARGSSLAATVGLTRAAESGDIFTTGTLSYSRELPEGGLTASLTRSFGTNSDDDEEVQTSLALGATYALTPIATLALDAAYAQVEETGTGTSSEISSIGAVVSYDLTPLWDLEAGITYETRDTDTTTAADSTSLSVTLSRDFSFRP